MKNFTPKLLAVQIGILLAASVSVQAAFIYSNSSNDTGYNLNLVNGQTVGNQVNLSVGSAYITSFDFEIQNSATVSGTPQIQATLYKNDGPAFNGYATPGSIYYQSSFSPLSTTGGLLYTLNYVVPSILVGNTLTLALSVTGVTTGQIGVALFDAPSVGQNFNDYFLNTGSGWTLQNYGIPNQPAATGFGSRIQGTAAPDATSTAMLLGAGVSGLCLLRRKMS